MNARRAAFAGLLLVVWDPRPAGGWATREHRAIGTEAYTAACAQVAEEVDVAHAQDAALVARFDEACANVDVDRRLHYYNLARANSGHFHPAVTREWRRYHDDAIQRALSAAKLQGVAQSAEFERGFYENAFADHFLQ